MLLAGRMVYPRNKKRATNALKRAEFKCESDKEHKTFTRKNSNTSYTEPHHIIPLKFFEDFSCSLDVEANIVSLCSHCHNLIHYGKDAEKLIEKLWQTRKEQLEAAGIKIELEKLKSYYNL